MFSVEMDTCLKNLEKVYEEEIKELKTLSDKTSKFHEKCLTARTFGAFVSSLGTTAVVAAALTPVTGKIKPLQ